MATVSIPSFTGLKAAAAATKLTTTVKVAAAPKMVMAKASLKQAGVAAVIATAASTILASSAMAIDVKLGGDGGELAFVPGNFSVASGETIVFKNNAGFPHNIVFDEDEIPAGVDASKISQGEYLNGPGETYSVTLTEKGTYSFYCEPHQGAGMVGKVTVN